ncbi:hypothetical protein KP003_06840 [Geomonas nitrogeniifigens]|uniref:DNA2/NAM7 helicase-like C-terminal domain-containing protein n=1 Tax=Geomonas diazotrophica TaxID=2843197 RepID=A0ABX8JKP5_9BACT|nr:hypothetical protein [Geomonas nitrogeniifigens]QWV98959.1 hypothetical protein KP005_06680 [Geomonas nitrogeniifigens]QXE88108.1 hypothetical protein KP003_06840 [Geomonas nitrogeniifigens]
MSYNALNVAVTRARFGTRVFTNSIDDLERSELIDGKSSTRGKAMAPAREITHPQQRSITENGPTICKKTSANRNGSCSSRDTGCSVL